jgi:hypothetical protein
MAATEVMNRRRYAEASLLFGEAARGHDNPTPLRQLADSIRRLRPFDDRPVDPKDPVAIARRMLSVAIGGLSGPQDLRPRLARYLAPELLDGTEMEEMRAEFWRGVTDAGGDSDMSPVVMADMLAGVAGRAEGDPKTGFRVELQQDGRSSAMLIAARPEGLRAVAFGPSAAAAYEALRFGRAGDLQAARRWMGWLDAMRGRPKVATVDIAAALKAVAGAKVDGVLRGVPIDDLAQLEHDVALAMEGPLPSGPPPLDRTATLERCVASERQPARRRQCAFALVWVLRAAKRAPDALALLDRLGADAFGASAHEDLRHQVLIDIGRFAEVRALLAKQPPGPALRERSVAGRLTRGGDLRAAEAIYRRLAGADAPLASDLNHLAWARLHAGDAGDETLDWARRAVERSQRRSAASLHTLATVLAERGEVAEARDVLKESILRRGNREPNGHDHYVLGRIAEACGAHEAAVESYRRVTPPEVPDAVATSVLAERRLKALASTLAGRAAPDR